MLLDARPVVAVDERVDSHAAILPGLDEWTLRLLLSGVRGHDR